MAALTPTLFGLQIWPPCFVLITLLLATSHGFIEEIPTPKGLENCFTRYATKTSISKTVGRSINWICVHQFIWMLNGRNGWMGYNITREANAWYSNLLNKKPRRRLWKRATPRIRKEIRMLSEQERHDFLRAIQLLKADRSIYPNKFDAIAALHQGLTETSAHGGPNFLAWHRAYLTMFENALIEKVPEVTLPYWDSTLDEKMTNPARSVFWSELFVGSGNGIVNDGPFAGWMTSSGPLIRNIATTGSLFRTKDIQNILTRRFVGEITEPHAFTDFNLEFHHGEVHVWIDGQMGDLTTASLDPIFYLHHCYVDYIWQTFRQRQKMMGINPSRDYPSLVNHTMHAASSPLGLGNLRNIDGFSDAMIDGIYQYAPSPSCSARHRECGSPYLKCERFVSEWACVSVDKASIPSPRPIQNSLFNRNMPFSNRMTMNSSPIWNTLNRNALLQNRFQSGFSNNRFNFPSTNTSPIDKMGKGMGKPVIVNSGQTKMALSIVQDRTNPMNFEIVQRSMRTPNSTLQNLRDANIMHTNQMLSNRFSKTSPVNTAQSLTGTTSQNFFSGHFDQFQSQRQSNLEMCPAIPVNRPYQNTFNINGISDTRLWAYLPVQVVYRRPPDYKRYNAFPIYNSKPYQQTDIYSAATYKLIKNAFNPGDPASYPSCNTEQSGAGRVFVQSNGINYVGSYKEYAIVDHRMAISMSNAFVAVKSPERGVTDVLLSAYDSCGRVCRPYCKVPGSRTGEKRQCSGMLRITSRYPKLYGRDYGEAVYHTWGLQGSNCPTLDDSNIFVTFYCDYEEKWPLPGIVPINPIPQPKTSPIFIPNVGPVIACNIGNGCIIRDFCSPCLHGIKKRCEGTCSLFARCEWGIYKVERCLEGGMYNPATGSCVPGTCPEEEVPPTLWNPNQQTVDGD